MKIELVFIPSPGINNVRATAAMVKVLVNSDDRLFVTLVVIPERFSPGDTSSVYPESESRLRYYHLHAGDQSTDDQDQTYMSYIESQKPHVRKAVSKLAHEVSTHPESPRRLAGMVVEFFCTPMIDVADEFGLPAYTYFTSNASYLGLMFHVQHLHDQEHFDVTKLRDSDAELDVPSLTRPLPATCLPSVMLSKDWFPNLLLRARILRGTKGILVNSVAEIEPQALKFFSGGNGTPPLYAVGPILDLKTDSGDEKRREILRWLDEQPPRSVLFLCFGRMGGFSEKQATEMAVALERSGHRFLWSLRCAAPAEKIMTGAPPGEFTNLDAVLPQGFLDRTAKVGKIITWAPQVAVLAHPAVGGFVTHCGWNSILESLWFGVPMAAWPIYAEQQFNAFRMVEELGVAAEIRKDYRRDNLLGESEMVTAEEIERGINCVMEQDGEIRKRVEEMSEQFHMALMDGGSSTHAMRKFVQHVIENIS
ncbi:unnamed protein product [Brassica rapa]|uniref:Glycosyltransferase n=2 Tax=Brassica TaxID=3705 RepID=A0A816TQ85_BRANA|nr:UDP-glycosyltransferase 71B1-like [Brassica napus]CAF2099452.1 unnamed protein product [Brassica napus]CAG7876770.1 unnamed protein product [Brassica rapa]VDC71868.1 unnamed protein product [Brassica rapa]